VQRRAPGLGVQLRRSQPAPPPGAPMGAPPGAPMDRTSVMPSLHELPPDLVMPRREQPEEFAPPSRRADRAGRGDRSGRRGNRWALPLGVLVALALVAGVAAWALNNALYLTMPNVAGQTQAAAAQSLRGDGLGVTVVQEFSATVPAGQAIDTVPGAGSRVRKDASVTLDVSKGVDRPTVPAVAGRSLAAAKQAITAAGLAVGSVTQQSSSVPQGDVVSTDPAAGSRQQPNTVVNLVVSSGVPPAQLPDVVGEPVAQAMADLRSAGFAVQVNPTYVNSGVAAGSVAGQSPNGATASAGSTVTLTVSDGPVQVTVPDVRGDTEAQARSALTAAGFKVKVHKFLPFGDPTVTSQDPGAGSQADQGGTVTITLF
jgi:beta-lactam-binding protein with PASTA domain